MYGELSCSQSVHVTLIPSVDCCVQTYCLRLLVLWGTDEAFLCSVVQWNFQIEVHSQRHPTAIETKWADDSGVSQRCTHLGECHVTKEMLLSVRCSYTLSSFSSSLVISFLLTPTLIRIFFLQLEATLMDNSFQLELTVHCKQRSSDNQKCKMRANAFFVLRRNKSYIAFTTFHKIQDSRIFTVIW